MTLKGLFKAGTYVRTKSEFLEGVEMEDLVFILAAITAEDYDPTVVYNEEAKEIEKVKESKLEQVLEEV